MHISGSIAAGLRASALCLFIFTGGAALAQTATIEGTITETGSGTAIAGATVAVSDPEFTRRVVATTTTTATGDYSVTVDVPAGGSDQFLVEAAAPTHAPGRHGLAASPECFFGCDAPGGEVTVSDGSTLAGIDIALDAGGQVSGIITASDTGNPLGGASVELLPSNTLAGYSPHFIGNADPSGNYTTPLAVPPGDYHVLVEPAFGAYPAYADNYVPEAWNDRSCEFHRCPIANTDTVAVAASATTANIDFALEPGATLSGSLGPDNIEKQVALYDGSGKRLIAKFFYSGNLPATNWTFNGLSGGSYYVQLGPLSFSSYLRELHNGLACPWSGCDRARGSALNLPPRSTLSLPLVTLTQGGQISGQVVDIDTNSIPAGSPADANLGNYDIIDASGTVVGGGQISTDASGAVSLEPSFAVPPGDYYVRTHNEWLGDAIGDSGFGSVALPGYMDAITPDQPCAGVRCELSTATTVSVTAGNVTPIILEVDTGSRIDGTVVDAVSGTPIPSTVVRVVDAAGETLSAVLTDVNGDFEFGALPAGSYYVRTSMSGSVGPGHNGVHHAYFDKVYGASGNCSEALCDPTSGTAITLDGSTDESIGNLQVTSGPIITGQILEVPTGYVVLQGQVDVYTDAGEFVGSYKLGNLDATYYTTALPAGTYTLVPVVSPAYSAASTSGGNTPARMQTVSGVQEGFQVTIGSSNVEANVTVIDRALNELFSDRFDSDAP